MPIRIFVIEDNPLYREVLCEFLDGRFDFQICGAAGTVREALTLLPEVEATVVLIDITLSDRNGIELVGELLSSQPDLRCLMLSGSDRMGNVEKAFAAGAWGYLVKSGSHELEEGIQHVAAGDLYLSRQLQPTYAFDKLKAGSG